MTSIERQNTGSGETGAGDHRRLVYVPVAELDRWQCRALGTIPILDLKERVVGHLDGIVIDRDDDRPVYLVIATARGAGEPQSWFLIPIGDAWFDDTERAVRTDAARREQLSFDPGEFQHMSSEQADAYERRVLADCCPELGFRRDGTPDYEKLQRFQCPVWLRPSPG